MKVTGIKKINKNWDKTEYWERKMRLDLVLQSKIRGCCIEWKDYGFAHLLLLRRVLLINKNLLILVLAYNGWWWGLVFEATCYRYSCFDLLQSLKPRCSRLSDILLQVWIRKPSQSHPSAWVSTPSVAVSQPAFVLCLQHEMLEFCWVLKRSAREVSFMMQRLWRLPTLRCSERKRSKKSSGSFCVTEIWWIFHDEFGCWWFDGALRLLQFINEFVCTTFSPCQVQWQIGVFMDTVSLSSLTGLNMT